MSTLSQPLLPAPVAPPNRPCRRRNSTRHGAASSNGPRSMGSVIDVTDGPGQVMASACGSMSSTRSSKRLARSSGVGWTRTAPRKVPRPDSMAGIFAITSRMVWPRARRKRARQPQTSTMADMTCDPARPMAVAISGHDSSMRSTRTLARRRWLAHQGSAQIRVRPAARAGIGDVAGPTAVAAVSHPPATTVTAPA